MNFSLFLLIIVSIFVVLFLIAYNYQKNFNKSSNSQYLLATQRMPKFRKNINIGNNLFNNLLSSQSQLQFQSQPQLQSQSQSKLQSQSQSKKKSRRRSINKTRFAGVSNNIQNDNAKVIANRLFRRKQSVENDEIIPLINLRIKGLEKKINITTNSTNEKLLYELNTMKEVLPLLDNNSTFTDLYNIYDNLIEKRDKIKNADNEKDIKLLKKFKNNFIIFEE